GRTGGLSALVGHAAAATALAGVRVAGLAAVLGVAQVAAAAAVGLVAALARAHFCGAPGTAGGSAAALAGLTAAAAGLAGRTAGARVGFAVDGARAAVAHHAAAARAGRGSRERRAHGLVH